MIFFLWLNGWGTWLDRKLQSTGYYSYLVSNSVIQFQCDMFIQKDLPSVYPCWLPFIYFLCLHALRLLGVHQYGFFPMFHPLTYCFFYNFFNFCSPYLHLRIHYKPLRCSFPMDILANSFSFLLYILHVSSVKLKF